MTSGDRDPVVSASFAARERRRYGVIGVCAIIGGLWLSTMALDSIRTGIPIPMLNGPAIEGWVALAAAAFVIALGASAIGVGLGYIKLRNTPDR